MAILEAKEYEVTLEADDFECIVDMAGYGIQYWAEKATVDDNLYTVEYLDPEDDEKLVIAEITPLMIASSWEKILNGEVEVSSYYADCLRVADCGEIDADVADVMIQIAIFNKIIFG
jgi:hypothetical protein